MKLGRCIVAHICAVFIGAWVIMVGIHAISAGLTGIVDGTLRWIGGFMVFAFLAILSLPLGLILRVVIGQLPVAARVGAIAGGSVVGLATFTLALRHR